MGVERASANVRLQQASSGRRARYAARNPVAPERLAYDRAAKAVTSRSDKSELPTAGTETVDPLAFLARALFHIPDKEQMTTRYDGWYADAPPAIVPMSRLAPTDAAGRCAALLQQIVEVDFLACPSCHRVMRIVAFIPLASAIDQLLLQLRTREAQAGLRSGPSTRTPERSGTSRASVAASTVC